jgi:hypothetical protein
MGGHPPILFPAKLVSLREERGEGERGRGGRVASRGCTERKRVDKVGERRTSRKLEEEDVGSWVERLEEGAKKLLKEAAVHVFLEIVMSEIVRFEEREEEENA